MAYEAYEAFLSIAPLTSQGYYSDATQELINLQFSESPNCYTIEYKNASNVFVEIDARVISVKDAETGKQLGDDFKKLLFKDFDVEFTLGSIFNFGDYHWIATNTNTIKHNINSVVVRRANHTLKWINNSGDTISEDCIVDYNFTYLSGVGSSYDQQRLGDKQYALLLPSNTDTSALVRGKRFIIDNLAYRATNIDRVTKSGLCQIIVEEDQTNTNYDDLTNGIANAFNQYTYSLDILTDDLSIGLSSTPTIEYNVLRDDNIISGKTVLFTSSNTDIATVSSVGKITPITIGSCTITLVLSDNADVTGSVSVEVTNSIESNESEELIGDDDIGKGLSGVYNIYRYVNGINSGDGYTFAITGTAGTLTAISDNSVRVNGVSVGTVTLTATNKTTADEFTKTISIKTLW